MDPESERKSIGGCDGHAKAQAAATGVPSTAKRSHSTSEVRGRSQEDPMPEGQWPRGVTPRPRSGAAAGRSYPTPEARGSSREDQPHVQGAVAAWAQKGLEELSHIEGQEGRQ